jgi:phospholipid/cholesterol/gamma-HCH transport system substrate-binding protein
MKKYSMETTVGLFVVIGLLCVGYMAVKLGKVSLLGSEYYTLTAKFTSVSGLRVNSAIEMFGIEIGRVDGLNVNQEDQTAVAVMKISKDTKVMMTLHPYDGGPDRGPVHRSAQQVRRMIRASWT